MPTRRDARVAALFTMKGFSPDLFVADESSLDVKTVSVTGCWQSWRNKNKPIKSPYFTFSCRSRRVPSKWHKGHLICCVRHCICSRSTIMLWTPVNGTEENTHLTCSNFCSVRERTYSTMGEGERLGLFLTADVEGWGSFEKKKFEKKYYFFLIN